MENGAKRWGFKSNEALEGPASISIRGYLTALLGNVNQDDERALIPLGHGDPSHFPSYRTTPVAEDAVVEAVRSAKYNSYPPTNGLLAARRAVAEYLSRDLPFQVSPDDVCITVGCGQAIEIILAALARPGANILLPRPGFPAYEARAAFDKLEVRHYDLLPERNWEVDLEAVEALADENTVAIVIINPCNPCGNVFSSQHLRKIAETAYKLGILVVADEVYDHYAFGATPFIPMAGFSSIVPVITLGAISKRWVVPGWRLGWLVINDANGILKDSGVVQSIMNYLNIASDTPTFLQGALPYILENTKEEFFSETVKTTKEAAELCYEKIKEIPCITCPSKPEGSMFLMVKLHQSMLEDINDDMEFCLKLIREESVMILPGRAVGLPNWLRITFAVEKEALVEGFDRIKAFYHRHAKKQ